MNNKSVIYAATLCVLANLIGSIVGYSQVPDFAKLNSQLRAAITNKNTPDNILLESISRLGRITESPRFWTQVADDPSYSYRHRMRAVFALFRRHGERCGGLPDLRRCIAPAGWLKSSKIERVSFVFGWVPVEVHPEESIFAISVFERPKIYIRMRGNISVDTFVSELQEINQKVPKVDLTIMQFGYGDDYEKWLANGQLR
jgi:hypothetical protein